MWNTCERWCNKTSGLADGSDRTPWRGGLWGREVQAPTDYMVCDEMTSWHSKISYSSKNGVIGFPSYYEVLVTGFELHQPVAIPSRTTPRTPCGLEAARLGLQPPQRERDLPVQGPERDTTEQRR